MFEFFFHVSFTHFLKIICFQEKITQLYVKKKTHFWQKIFSELQYLINI